MKDKTYVFSLCVIIIFIFVTLNDSISAEESKVDINSFEENIKFRQMLGLEHNDTVKKQLKRISLEGKVPNNVVIKYGYILTKDEDQILTDRFKNLEEDIPKIEDYLKNNITQDYSIYIDHSKSGIIVIGTKNEIDKNLLTNLENKSNLPVENKVVPLVKGELISLTDKIFEAKDNIHDEYGINIVGVSSDVTEGKLLIEILDFNENKANVLKELYEDIPLEVFEGEIQKEENYEPQRFYYHGYMFGGAAISNTASSSKKYYEAKCSAGFNAIDRTSGNVYLITAAHCQGQSWYQGGQYIGSRYKESYNRYTDVMAIDLTRNISHYVAYANNPKSVTLTGYTPTQNQVAEDLACISGKTSGTTCGVIKDTYSCATFENSGEFCGVKASYTANRGDSGGTVFSFNGNLLGVHKGGTSAEWYTGISRIISNLNIHPVVGGY